MQNRHRTKPIQINRPQSSKRTTNKGYPATVQSGNNGEACRLRVSTVASGDLGAPCNSIFQNSASIAVDFDPATAAEVQGVSRQVGRNGKIKMSKPLADAFAKQIRSTGNVESQPISNQ